jgi:hypothetical protein
MSTEMMVFAGLALLGGPLRGTSFLNTPKVRSRLNYPNELCCWKNH